MQYLTGRILNNRYQVKKLIGRGGMSTVYQAIDLIRSVDCAIKVLNEELAIDQVFIRRFTR